MILRRYEVSDFGELSELMLLENIHHLGFVIPDCQTMIIADDKGIIGFFTLRLIKSEISILHHFLIKRERRGLSRNAFTLVGLLKSYLHSLGRKLLIIDSNKENRAMCSFIEKMFKVVKIRDLDGHRIYSVRC